jgi:hypothetical protein
MTTTKLLALALAMGAFAGCDGGGNNGGGPKGAVSGRVPYLISAPSATHSINAIDFAKHDVTVTIEADGPTGVQFVTAWILDDTNMNVASLEFVNIAGTRLWRATTNTLLPMPAGQYRIDDIVLDDGDPFTANPLRTGWYMLIDIFSTSAYYVDERETSGNNITYYNGGLSAVPITRFALP